MSAYGLSRAAAAELLAWHRDAGSLLHAVLQARRVWHYAPIEDLFSVLSFGPWAEHTFQLVANPFHSGGFFAPRHQKWGSDNHRTASS